MTELDRSRAAALAGFSVPAALLALTVFAFLNDTMKPIGWHGGEYAYAFVWITFGAALAGLVVRATAPGPWRSLGAGLALAGAAGLVVVIATVAVLVTPVAVALAESLAVSPRPFLVAVMMAASAAFATPFGYQTNVIVYQMAGYRYMDFVRIGLPLILLTCAVAIVAIQAFFPF